jgi:hypothetical protein
MVNKREAAICGLDFAIGRLHGHLQYLIEACTRRGHLALVSGFEFFGLVFLVFFFFVCFFRSGLFHARDGFCFIVSALAHVYTQYLFCFELFILKKKFIPPRSATTRARRGGPPWAGHARQG